MLNKVISAIEKYDMLKYNEKVTVALSGGADSVCLLYVLSELAEKYKITLSAIHINHMLRGEESNRDEAFVRSLCEKKGIPLDVKRIDVMSIAEKTGESIELAARNVRYKAFSEIDCGLVATAHSADDHLETVLYNITRGSGLRGVCGIPPTRDIYIRPLIFCTRQEIEDYLKEKGAKFVTDSSNLTDEYTRNFLRHNVVPALQKVNPSVNKTVATMCASLREDEEFLSNFAKRIYLLAQREDFLDSEVLKVQPNSIIKRVIALYLEDKFAAKTDALHLENLKSILISGGKTSINNGITAFCKNGRFYFSSDKTKISKPVYFVQQKETFVKNSSNVNNLFLKNAVDCDKINGKLIVRTREPFDKIRLLGRNCTKSLKKLMNELKIPEELRDIIPVAADNGGVVWVYGVGVDERVAVDKNTNKAIEFITNNKS